MTVFYIILRDGDPVTNDDMDEAFHEMFEETGDELYRIVRDEIIWVWDAKEDAEKYCDYVRNVFPDSEMTVAELHLVLSTTEWN